MPNFSQPKRSDFGRNKGSVALEQQLGLGQVWKKGEEDEERERAGGPFTAALPRQAGWRGRARPNFKIRPDALVHVTLQACHVSSALARLDSVTNAAAPHALARQRCHAAPAGMARPN